MDASQSFQLPEKAAEANYVPAMSSLSVAYAEQKTPVCGERATYWAMKAADAGDPRGRLVLGFEYNTGNCIAMMASGELYSHGNGVPADNAQVQSWQASRVVPHRLMDGKPREQCLVMPPRPSPASV